MIKKTIVFLFFCNISFFAFSQENKNNSQNMAVIVQQQAEYPKGEKALYEFIYINLKFPSTKGELVSGDVFLSFDVMPDSSLVNFVFISKVGYGIDEEIEKLLKPLKYRPSIQNGILVKQNVMLSIPINIRIP